MPLIIVASANPPKIRSAKLGFERVFPNQEWIVEGHPMPSGVSEQPMTDEESIRGARNRATSAKQVYPDADYWVGMEGGVEERTDGMAERAWMVVIDKDGREGLGSSGTFFLPPRIAEIIRSGKDLGDACDMVFTGTDCRKANGAVGLLTGDAMERTTLYEHGMILALIPFRQPTLFPL